MKRYGALLCLAILLPALNLGGEENYILQKGDTLYRLSKRFDVPLSVLQEYNGIGNPAQLKEGASILIPLPYVVKKGDTLYGIAREHGVELAELLKTNGISDSAKLSIGRKLYLPLPKKAPMAVRNDAESAAENAEKKPASVKEAPFFWPHPGKRESLSGRITGAVIYGQAGDRVVSVSTGRVVWVGPYRGFSRVVLIEAENGYTYVYAGNEETLVAVGDRVRQGSEIGLLGRNAHQGIPQLYFLVYRDGVPVDPSQAPRS